MPPIPDPVHALVRDLQGVFGARLRSVVIYGTDGQGHESLHHGHHVHSEAPTHTMALVETVAFDDLRACAHRAAGWHAAGLATPLVLSGREFERSLDVFPLEFGAILDHHVVAFGQEPFDTLKVNPVDVRRACEVQARSHLLHLREGFVETRGRGDALAVLIVQSAQPLAALLQALAHLENAGATDGASAARQAERALGLDGGILEEVVDLAHVTEIPSADATRIFPGYLNAIERLVALVDEWSAAR